MSKVEERELVVDSLNYLGPERVQKPAQETVDPSQAM